MPDHQSKALALRSALEARTLELSIGATLLAAGLGILFGVVSGSFAVVFDGFFSLVDAAVTWAMLLVARLVSRESSSRFQYGYWHLEPLVLGLKATSLILLLAYAFVGAVASLLSGGYRVQLGPAILYSVLTLALCLAVTIRMRQHNARLGSALVRLDAQAWLTSTIVTGALLLAFLATRAMEGTGLSWAIPYMDPGVLALLTLALLPVPLKEAGIAFRDIFGITPAALDAHVRAVMADFVAAHGFAGFESYVTRAGRAAFIEISVLVPADMPAMPVAHFDRLRAEIGAAIGEEGPDRWLTIVFTADPAQV
jgi:predicted Co/Zn/Cd cation transporter (cation efflux family)